MNKKSSLKTKITDFLNSFKMSSNSPTRSSGGNIIMFIFLFAASIFMLLPLVYAISNALKPLDELFAFPPKFFVVRPTFQNFSDLFNLVNAGWVPFSRYIFNNIFITTFGTLGNIVISSAAAFVLAKHDFIGKKAIFKVVVLSLMFSGAVTAIPNFITMRQLGWIDTYWAIIIPAFQSSLGLYLMKQFMEGVPDSLIESARISGASEFTVFVKIVMPIVKPAWLTLALLSIQALWNTNSIFIYTENNKTISQVISQIVSGAGTSIARAGVAAAAAVLMMSIPIISFIITQSNVIQTMASSGMKD